jgi:hypothetical protein
MKTRCLVGLVGWGLGVALLGAGCTKKAGDSCSGEQVLCTSTSRALECVNGKLEDVACLGPVGCVEVAHRCDRSKTEAGSACSGDWAACTPDGKQFLECKGNKLVQTGTCSGPRGCYPSGNELRCDQSQANPGDICSGDGVACGTDPKQLMRCKDGKFVLDGACRGASGCRDIAGRIECDQTIGAVGDKCEGTGSACDPDGKALLTCKNNKLERVNACRGPEGCQVVGPNVRCDRSVGVVGDTCEGDSAACSQDGKSLLTCRSGKLMERRKCKKCSATGSLIECR